MLLALGLHALLNRAYTGSLRLADSNGYSWGRELTILKMPS